MNNTAVDFMCGQIRKCNRMMDDKTTYCVCCRKCYDKYYFKHTHRQSRKHNRNHVDLIKYLCNSGDDRAVDIMLYVVDNN
jgi:hypothetical protein